VSSKLFAYPVLHHLGSELRHPSTTLKAEAAKISRTDHYQKVRKSKNTQTDCQTIWINTSMSSFFTAPASQRKRKREDTAAVPSRKRATGTGSKPNTQNAKPARPKRDESISSSGSEDGARRQMPSDEEKYISSESDDEDETGAERRLRLAERYLENIKGEVDEVGFDAEEIDRDLIAERLQEDVVGIKKSTLHGCRRA